MMKFNQLNALYKNISKIGLRYNNVTKINDNLVINNIINKISVNNYHSSNINYSRKSGSNALEPSPRDFSKKQIKRKSKRIELRETKIDSRKEKIKENFTNKQIESPQLKELLASTNDNVMNILDKLMLPGSGINEDFFKNDSIMFGMNDDANNVKKIIDPYTTLALLRKNRRLRMIIEEEDNELKLLNSSKDNIKQQHHDEHHHHQQQQQSNELVNIDIIEEQISNKKSNISTLEDQIVYVYPNKANRSLVLLAKEQFSRKIDILEMLDLMKESDIKISVFTYTSLILSASKKNDHDEAERLFNLMISEDNEPDPLAWSALIRSKCKKSYSEAKKALELIDQLQKTGVKVTGSMFTSVLKAFVDAKNYKDSYALWERMHSEGIELTKESFISMLKLSAQQSNPERAFFYIDEMKSLGIELDTRVFASLFRACAEAPHWVNGYHDIIFDAMTRMEGEELTPTPEIYNSIIYAFSRAGDAVASEFYFWEMKRKGIPVDAYTYNSLLNSFAKSQAVGAKEYGMKGRFVRPQDKEDTQFEKNYKALGATKSVEASLWQENDYLERGSRQRGKMVDLVDEDPDGQDLLEDEIRREGDKAVALRNQYSNSSNTTVMINDSNIDQDDPVMKQLLAEMGHDSLESFLNDDGDHDLNEEYDDNDDYSDNDFNDLSTKDIENISQDEIIKMFDSVSKEKKREEKKILELHNNNKKKEPKKESTKTKKMFANNDVNDFTDPFQDKDYSSSASLRSHESKSKEISGILNLLDTRSEEIDRPVKSNRVKRVDLEDNNPTPAKFSDELVLFNNNNDDDENEIKLTNKSVGKLGLESLTKRSVTDAILDDTWDSVEFGRAPDPDYSVSRGHRIRYNINMAEKVFADMQREGIKPDIITLTSFLSVYSEALRCEEATEIFNSFKNFDLQPSSSTYRSMIRMCIRNKDIKSALHYKEDMIENGVIPDGEIYGMLIQSYAHRNMIVDSLKLLEEVDDRKIKVPERHIKKLRVRCNALGFEHPSMPADPLLWVKRLKKKRRDTKLSSQRGIEPVRSSMYV